MSYPFRPQFVVRPGDPGRRPMVLFDATDAGRFHATIRPVAGLVDSSLGPCVVADRLNFGTLPPHGHGWLLAWRPALDNLRRRASILAARGLVTVLRTDVEGCFANISPGVVAASLLKLGAHPSQAGSVLDLLEAVEGSGVRGLPVGPAGSSVLANAVLATPDRALSPTPFLRWVDDYFVFARNEAEAVGALERLSDALAEVGLRPAEHKTHIGHLSSVGGRSLSGVGVAPALQSLAT